MYVCVCRQIKDILDAAMLEYYSLDWLNADSYSGPAFSSMGRSREIYGAFLKVKQFQLEQIKVDGINKIKTQKGKDTGEENNRLVRQ